MTKQIYIYNAMTFPLSQHEDKPIQWLKVSPGPVSSLALSSGSLQQNLLICAGLLQENVQKWCTNASQESQILLAAYSTRPFLFGVGSITCLCLPYCMIAK